MITCSEYARLVATLENEPNVILNTIEDYDNWLDKLRCSQEFAKLGKYKEAYEIIQLVEIDICENNFKKPQDMNLLDFIWYKIIVYHYMSTYQWKSIGDASICLEYIDKAISLAQRYDREELPDLWVDRISLIYNLGRIAEASKEVEEAILKYKHLQHTDTGKYYFIYANWLKGEMLSQNCEWEAAASSMKQALILLFSKRQEYLRKVREIWLLNGSNHEITFTEYKRMFKGYVTIHIDLRIESYS